MDKFKCVIIDDEANNREAIRKLIRLLNHNLEIVGEADSVESGFIIIKDLQPQLVFLDVKMSDGTGFDMLNLFEYINFEVVFITAYDNFAINAFRFNALDYLLKPIDNLAFRETLRRVENKMQLKSGSTEEIRALLEEYNKSLNKEVKITVHHASKVEILNASEIIYVQSNQGITSFTTNNNKVYNSSKHLGSFELILDSLSYFVKINKSVYVNLNFIQNYTKGFYCTITMKNAAIFEISRRKKGELLGILDNTSFLNNS